MKTFNELRNLSWTELRRKLEGEFKLEEIIERSKNHTLYSINVLEANRKKVPANSGRSERELEQKLFGNGKLCNDNEKILIYQYPTQRGGKSNIDLLGFNESEGQLIIVELKQAGNPDQLPKVILQCMDYWCFVWNRISDFKTMIKEDKGFEVNEKKEPEIFIVAPSKYFTSRRNINNNEFNIAQKLVETLGKQKIVIKVIYVKIENSTIKLEYNSKYFNGINE